MDKESNSSQCFKSLFYFFLLLLSVNLFSCQGGEVEGKKKAGEVISWVNGKPILYGDFIALFEEKTDHDMGENNRDEIEELKRNVLNLLIEKKLILEEGKRLGITIKDTGLEGTIGAIRKDIEEDETMADVVGKDVQFENWEESLETNILIRTIVDRVISPNVEVTEEEAVDYYNGHSEDFARDEEFRALQITVKTEKEATNVLAMLKKGEDFREMAEKYSLSPDKADGGDLGFFMRGEMPESFENAISSLSKGEVSHIVKSPYGYHIFKLVEKRGKRVVDFSDVKNEIVLSLQLEKGRSAFRNWIDELKERADIKTDQELWERI